MTISTKLPTKDISTGSNTLSDQIRSSLKESFIKTREDTVILTKPLSDEDQIIQTIPDVSPTKWHLAHTSWFFETFILKPYQSYYKPKHPIYNHLFNSYYQQIGSQWPRHKRGLISRPSLADIKSYRNYIDGAIINLIDNTHSKIFNDIKPLIVLGIHHEKQHQELILTDIKHVMGLNPMKPAIYPDREAHQKLDKKNTRARKG